MAKGQKSCTSDLSVISLMRQYIGKEYKGGSVKNNKQLTNYFEKYLKQKKIKDIWTNMTYATLKGFEGYLKDIQTHFFSFLPKKTLGRTGKATNIRFDTYQQRSNNEHNNQVMPLDGLIEAIYNKYKDCDIKEITDSEENHYRNNIKELCKLINIDREVRIKPSKKNGFQQFDKLYNKISSHSARHTFVTNCYRYLGYERDQIIRMTGHKDTKILDEVYLNLDTYAIIDDLANPKNLPATPSHIPVSCTSNYLYESLPSTKEEFRTVLKMLGNAIGINPLEYEGISDIRSLCRLLLDYESKIINLCKGKIDILRIKEIFNENSNEEERNQYFLNLINTLKVQ